MKTLLELEREVFLLKEPDPELGKTIRERFGVSDLTAKIIANRGLHTIQEIDGYLKPLLKNIPDPFAFRDMRRIVERIYRAIKDGETILVYGDYDVDGITATALLIRFFKQIGHSAVRYYIPDRFKDGYGLNRERLIGLYRLTPFQVLITVDCGITAGEAIETMAGLGVDTIVTDHHRAETGPPAALGVLDPSLKDCGFPFKNLAGVGVAFFLLIALRSHLREVGYWKSRDIPEPDLRRFLDIVSIGTIADMVPLIGINRIIARFGLTMLSNTSHPGLRSFLETLKLIGERTISPWDVSFKIAPRFNAAGRLERGDPGVSLLTIEDNAEAFSITHRLEELNRQRQEIENRILKDAIERVESRRGFVSPFAIVQWNDTWHEGVIGIVASKLVERYGRSVALISLDGEHGKGSLRGTPGNNIFEALQACSPWLVSYGGHPMAGGLRIHRKNLEAFSKSFSDSLQRQRNGIPPKKEWRIDAMIGAEGIPDEFFSELAMLEPFGLGNPAPLLGLREFQIQSPSLLQGKHIRFTLKQGDNKALQAIAFNAAEAWEKLKNVSTIIGVPGINHWNGRAIPQMNIKKFLVDHLDL